MPALSAKNVLNVEKTTPPSIFGLPPWPRTSSKSRRKAGNEGIFQFSGKLFALICLLRLSGYTLIRGETAMLDGSDNKGVSNSILG
jgi:hypothetical protein